MNDSKKALYSPLATEDAPPAYSTDAVAFPVLNTQLGINSTQQQPVRARSFFYTDPKLIHAHSDRPPSRK
jgi:uncharacterized protein (DUF924 family)